MKPVSRPQSRTADPLLRVGSELPTETTSLLVAPQRARSGISAASRAPEDAPPARSRRVIGVMGGMGPAAANDFGKKLIDLKTAACDQDHARVLLDQATDIPDRTSAILNHTQSPVPAMEASLKRLDRGGADLVAITCNTAHHYFGDMQVAIDRFGLKLELLHIVDATMAELERQAPGATRIGLLATSGTLDANIYQTRAAQQGHDKTWLSPSPKTQTDHVMAGIYQGVKAGNMEYGREHLELAARELQDMGAEAILLACTEIPLVLTSGSMQGADGKAVPLIDTLGALAKQALELAERPPSQVVTGHGCFEVAAAGLNGFVQSASAFIGGTPERPRRIGVMGGMGPAAAMQFSQYMVRFNEGATRDQQHVQMLVDQATDIPDRTRAIQGVGPDPVAEMQASLHRLAAAGADEIVMTCNTAHHFFPQVQAAIEREHPGVRAIHIVDATMKLLDQQAPGAKRIGLLATSGTVDQQIYQKRAAGREWLTPDPQTQGEVMEGIYGGVKAGDLDSGRAHLLAAAQKLVDAGADAILLACTEIPLVLKTGDVKDKDGKPVPLIDTLEAQAREAIARANVPVPATPGLVQQVRQWLAPQMAAPARAAFV